MRLILSFLLVVSLFAQSAAGPIVDPALRYPGSPQTIVIVEAYKVRSMKGSVRGRGGIQITGPVLVELVRGPGNDERLDARLCDEEGAFDFGKLKKGRYYVKVSMQGWDTLYFPVWLGSRGQRTLSLELQLST